ncbi:hypothetical protein MNB_ARC-1_750 [hydrothermal vent metagenome]|uniref:DUF2914 domain-containing protein n=1 Tax=hydrothermal vent metagenome TaxID=652676 RepID=A0A3B1E5M2_9ZZZZ
MIKILYIVFMVILINSNSIANNHKVDCIILEDENSIICKYIQTRVSYDKTVIFEWINPSGEISRTRELIIPAGHGSLYDYRYIQGRSLGVWTFRVIDDTKEYKTNFTIK